MKTFQVHLQDTTHVERLEDVVSFVAEDRSGSFGIQAGHVRTIASLTFGLARYGTQDGEWHYLALPGGLLYFTGGELYISTRHYLRGDDLEQVGIQLDEQLRAEEESLKTIRDSLHHMERELIRRLWQMERGEAP